MLIEHMGEGRSYETFAAVAEVGRSTIYDWELIYPEWVEAKKIAFMARDYKVEDRLLSSAIDGTDCNAALILLAKNVLKMRSEPNLEQNDSNVNLNITFAEASEDDRPE